MLNKIWNWIKGDDEPMEPAYFAAILHKKPNKNMNEYPESWPGIATGIKSKAGWKCERCKHIHDFESGHVLTVHHLDGNKANVEEWNLAALCQRCHLRIQGRVHMDQFFMSEILDVSEWFKPHLEGYLKSLKK